MLSDELNAIALKASNDIVLVSSIKQLDNIKSYYLGKSGLLTSYLKKLSSISDITQRKQAGSTVNSVCNKIKSEIQTKKNLLLQKEIDERLMKEKIDISLPIRPQKFGKLHPISKVINELKHIFSFLGFSLADGPEIEDEFHVFDALNTPDYHPARQMQDTFYIKEKINNKKILLRSHTSSVQIRTMEKNNTPPIKIIAPGRVYRNDWDSTHSPMFHQLEGLYIDKNISMGHLKYCINYFLNKFFGKEVKTRFRNSFFPFTEPSAEVDIYDDGNNKWIEILGCGMVHPEVLRNVNIDPNIYTGFAFGMGIERITMIKYDISDLREFYSNKIQWLDYYGFCFTDLKT